MSVKSSDVFLSIAAYRKLSKVTDYPLHLGVTEAGSFISGSIKSSIGLGSLLMDGIGDTIRISLSDDPVKEIKIGNEILKSLKNEVVDLASDVLAREAPTAAFKLIEVMKSDKPVPQANNKLQAAQTILDRAGVVKTDKVDINHNVSGGIFILPEKHTIDIEAEDVSYE